MITSIGIDIGHNCPPDTGAIGIKKEDALVMEVGQLIIGLLKSQGIKVFECKPAGAVSVRESLEIRCSIANKNNVHLFCSLHFNAFNKLANGTEVYAISPVGRNVASCVLKELVGLGFSNRGVKDGSHLYVIRNTQMPAMLTEFAFCDSKKDMVNYDPEETANAFVTGLINGIKAKNTNALLPIAFDISFPILRVNHGYGEFVAKLQQYFNLPVDNFFDSTLEKEIKKKQGQLGLLQDGYVDETLWHLIFDSYSIE